MESTISSKKIILKFFMLLFAINVSFSILPGSITLSYGIFGEVASVSSEEDQESGIRSNPNKRNLNKRNLNKKKLTKNNFKKRVIPLTSKKKHNIQYAWFLLIIMVLFIHYLQFCHIYMNDVTPVGLKVRMDN